MSSLILSNCNTNNNNENGILEIGTGEILSDKRPNGKERPWRLHKMNSLKLHSLYGKALRVDDSVITENRLQSLEQCGDNLLFSVNDKNEKLNANFRSKFWHFFRVVFLVFIL